MTRIDVLALLLAGSSALAQSEPVPPDASAMYRWTDGKGVVHYGPNPPPGVEATLVKLRDSRLGGTNARSTKPQPSESAANPAGSDTMATGQERFAAPQGRFSRTFNDDVYSDNCALSRQSHQVFSGRTATVWDPERGQMRTLSPEETAAKRSHWEREIDRFCARDPN